MPDLTLKNVSKSFPGGVQAVEDFNIEIEHGEFIVLVGPSGCGKTTVLRMIAGLEEITSGDMMLDGKRINNVAPSDRDISMVFQNYALYGHMSVYENIGFSKTIRHENQNEIHEQVMEAAEIVELRSELNRFPRNLSGGQRQRVALGRSIVSRAGIILMDEPLSNLDAKLRGQARWELIKLHRKLENTFIYVTHDQIEAMTMAGRIVVMSDGRVQQIGTPHEVYRWPQNLFVAGFIGSPAMNFFKGEVSGDQFTSTGLAFDIPERIMARYPEGLSGEMVLGVRPEHFSLEGGTDMPELAGEVVDVEFLGDRSLVYVDRGGVIIVASLKLKEKPAMGSELKVFIDPGPAHFFDTKTGERIFEEGEER